MNEDKSLESKINASDYSFSDVLKNPLKSAIEEIFTDLNNSDLFSGKKPLTKKIKSDLATIAAFGAVIVPHELLHAGTNKLLGNVNKEIVINKLYGGDLWSYIIPGIESRLMNPFLGGYVQAEFSSVPSYFITSLAPYVLTPLGVYLLYEGKNRKNKTLAVLGSGMVAAHFGGILGDFFGMGMSLAYNTTDAFYRMIGENGFETQSDLSKFFLLVGGFYAGAKLMSFTYRMSKASVNYLKKWFKK